MKQIKKCLALVLLAMLVLSAMPVSAAGNMVTIYSQYGSALIPENELETYLGLGWSATPVKLNNITQLPTTIYVSDKYSTDVLDILQFDVDYYEYVSSSNIIRIHYDLEYDETGYVFLDMMCFDSYGNHIRTVELNRYSDQIDVPSNTATFSIVGRTSYGEHTSGGYYHCKQVDLFAMDGRIITVYDVQTPLYTSVGWYEAVTMYALDGRTVEVAPYDVEAYKQVGWYTEAGYAFEGFKTEVNAHKARGDYNSAMKMFDEYENLFESTEYQYSVQLEKEKVMDLWRNSIRCPLAITGERYVGTSYGTPSTSIYFRNVSYKKIVGFKLNFTCYNIFGEVEKTYYTYYYCDEADLESGSEDWYRWVLYGADSVSRIDNIRITEVVFADGTKW